MSGIANRQGTNAHSIPDQTKLKANASKHSAMSHAHAVKVLEQLECEVKELTARAEEADRQEHSQCETKLPEEIARQQPVTQPKRSSALQRAADPLKQSDCPSLTGC